MSEEKKEEKKEDPTGPQKKAEDAKPQGQTEVKPEATKPEAPKAEAPKAEVPSPEPPAVPQAQGAEDAPAPQASPVKEEKKTMPEAKKEKPSNCAGCNKSTKKKRWYYRNGNFYCTHRCWKSTLKKEAKPEEAKA